MPPPHLISYNQTPEQVQPVNTIYIRASLEETHSVVAAEAAALALAAMLTHAMDMHQVSFLSDCNQLVTFLNAQDHSNPPDWRMLHFFQAIVEATSSRSCNFYRIDRALNSTADTLAKLAFTSPAVQFQNYVPSCSYQHNGHQCPLLGALTSVSLAQTRVLAASCC